MKIRSLSKRFDDFLLNHKGQLSEVVIEHTRFFSRNARTSHVSAQKLNLIKGVFYGLCLARLECPVHLIWIRGFNKGQAALLARAKGLPNSVSQHERDAYWLGYTWHTSPAPLRNQFLELSLEK